MRALQYDLFGQVAAEQEQQAQAERERIRDAMVVLRDVYPHALEVLWHLNYWKERTERSIGKSGQWAYSLRQDGFHFTHVEHWAGWDDTPANVITWPELRTVLVDDPRRDQVIEWVNFTKERCGPESWRSLYRPYELWPHPQRWHPSYIDADRSEPGWAERLNAWKLTTAIFDTAAIAHANPARGDL